MINKTSIKPLAFALGAAFTTGMSAPVAVNAADNPFEMTDMSTGYLVTAAAEGKCGGSKASSKNTEARCGAGKKADKEGKCGEGKCGASKKASREGKCGEGKCGASKNADKAGMKAVKEGKCGGSK